MYCNKRIITLAVTFVLLFAGPSMGQTRVLGLFQLGKSTQEEVKAKLPKGVKVFNDHEVEDINVRHRFSTAGAGYGIEGLEYATYSFNHKQKLIEVELQFKGPHFEDTKGGLTSKYQPYKCPYPHSMVYKANGDFVEIYGSKKGQKDKIFSVTYMSGSLYYATLGENETEAVAERKRQTKKDASEGIYTFNRGLQDVEEVQTAIGTLSVEHHIKVAGPESFKQGDYDYLKLNGNIIYKDNNALHLKNKVFHLKDYEVALLTQFPGGNIGYRLQLIQINRNGQIILIKPTNELDFYISVKDTRIKHRGNKLVFKHMRNVKDEKLYTWIYENGSLRLLK